VAVDRGGRNDNRQLRAFQRLAADIFGALSLIAGDGIAFLGNSITVLLDGASSGLVKSSTGLKVDLRDTDPCLELTTTGVGVIVEEGGGVETTPTGLGIKLDANPALVLSSNGLAVDLRDTTPCLERDATGIGATVKSDGGLQRTATGLALISQSGTVFPTTDLFIGQQFFRTDLVEMFTYDGTSWLGDVFTLSFGRNTGGFVPAGTNAVQPQGNVTSSSPYGYGNHLDTKVVGLRFNCGGAWTGSVNLYYGATSIHTENITNLYGFARDLNIDTDLHTQNGFRLEITVTSGFAYDPLGIVLLRRRF